MSVNNSVNELLDWPRERGPIVQLSSRGEVVSFVDGGLELRFRTSGPVAGCTS